MKTSEVHNTYNITETVRRLRELRALPTLKQDEAASRLGICQALRTAVYSGSLRQGSARRLKLVPH